MDDLSRRHDDDDWNPRAVMGGNNPPEPTPPETPVASPVPVDDGTVEGGVAAALHPLQQRLAALNVEIAKLPTIKDQASRDTAVEVGKKARALVNDIDADFTKVKAPYLQASQIVDRSYRVPKAEAKDALERLTDKVSAYDRAKALAARQAAEAEERRAREEEAKRMAAAATAEAAGRQAHAEKHSAKADAAAETAERAAAVAARSTNDITRSGGVSASASWKAEIVNRDDPGLRDALWSRIPLAEIQKAANGWVKANTTKGMKTAPALPGARVVEEIRTRL